MSLNIALFMHILEHLRVARSPDRRLPPPRLCGSLHVKELSADPIAVQLSEMLPQVEVQMENEERCLIVSALTIDCN
jgi:hypothetical protein